VVADPGPIYLTLQWFGNPAAVSPSARRTLCRSAIRRGPVRIVVELGRVALPVGLALVLEQPARVRVPEPAQPAAVPDVGAVRISVAIGVGVVLAMVGEQSIADPAPIAKPITAKVHSSQRGV
jgi:hypothetical protein